MKKKRLATEFGWRVLQKLAENRMSRKEFCEFYHISQSRLSEIITGYPTRRNFGVRSKIASLLGIDESRPHDRPADVISSPKRS